MAFEITPALAADAMAALRTSLNGGYLYYFAGPVPANPGDALDMVTQHTQLCRISLNGTATGITFAVPTNEVLLKTAAETWSGLVDFAGAQQATPTLTPTFFRFCASGDDGRDGAAGRKRIQGTIGAPASSADLVLGSDTLTDNGTNTESVGQFRYRAIIAQP